MEDKNENSPKLLQDEVNQIIEAKVNEKRINKMESLFTWFTWFTGIAIFLSTALVGFNVFINRSDFQRFENETKERINEFIGTEIGKSEVIAYAKINQNLEGSTINAVRLPNKVNLKEMKVLNWIIQFNICLKNIGNKKSDEIIVKFYFKKPISYHSRNETSSDEPEFDDEIVINSEELPNKGKIVPNLSYIHDFNILTGSFPHDPNVLHPFKIKIFNGTDKIFQSNFFIINCPKIILT